MSHTNTLVGESAQTVCAHFRHFWHRTHSSPLWFSENNPAQYKHSASASSSLSVPHLSPSDSGETADSLDDEESGGFLAIFLLFIMGSVLSFPAKDDSVLLFSFCCLVCLGQRDFRHLSFVPLSVGLGLNFRLFSSNSALYGEAVMIFDEPHLEGLPKFMTCFEIEGRGLAYLTKLAVLLK
jgi:hypothetical protein